MVALSAGLRAEVETLLKTVSLRCTQKLIWLSVRADTVRMKIPKAPEGSPFKTAQIRSSLFIAQEWDTCLRPPTLMQTSRCTH